MGNTKQTDLLADGMADIMSYELHIDNGTVAELD